MYNRHLLTYIDADDNVNDDDEGDTTNNEYL